jgi:hypothetical protein
MRHAQDVRHRVYSVERQFRVRIMVNDIKICDYMADFLVQYADGRKELVECKGFWTAEAKLKRKLFEATWLQDHPDIKYVIV